MLYTFSDYLLFHGKVVADCRYMESSPCWKKRSKRELQCPSPIGLYSNSIKRSSGNSIKLKPSTTELPCFIAIIFYGIYLSSNQALTGDLNENHYQRSPTIIGNENFTFLHNGSFLQIDAGREWPFNSKREISFKFRTKLPHGLLIYQTFDHNKLLKEDDTENFDLVPPSPSIKVVPPQAEKQPVDLPPQQPNEQDSHGGRILSTKSNKLRLNRLRRSKLDDNRNSVRHLNDHLDLRLATNSKGPPPLAQLSSSTITATASEKLVNSLFSASPIAAINNYDLPRLATSQTSSREKSLLLSSNNPNVVSSRDSSPIVRNRLLGNVEAPASRLNFVRRTDPNDTNDGSTILSSSTISSLSASLYELYIKLENGRLKIVYEFGSRLNQTYCGKGLNDDRWHKVELKVDPEINQMILILDQAITVEIVLSQPQHEDDPSRRELVFTNSILYLGGLNNNASIVKNVLQRLYMAQFIGCIGQIMLKTDQQPTETALEPAIIDRTVLVKRGCVNLCDTDNYCLHKSTCVNFYTHTKCDCFGTNHEDKYCWKDKLTTLTMLGYSTLVYRIYDWRDRHHSSINRMSLQFKTLAQDSVLFFAYGDLSAQQTLRNTMNPLMPTTTTTISNNLNGVPLANISNPLTLGRPPTYPFQGNSNYLAVSLSNGSIIVEVNFGDQPILLSSLLYDKLAANATFMRNSLGDSYAKTRPILFLADGRWHNVTLIHNNKQIHLYVDNYSINFTLLGKNNHLYFDPSIYIGAVPNFLLNETRALLKPFNLRHRFVGCLRSVYFNQHDILVALKQSQPVVEYRDVLGKAHLDSCSVQEPSSLPLTLRSGKSYLTFQLSSASSQQLQSLRLESASNNLNSLSSSTKNHATNNANLTHNNTDRPIKSQSSEPNIMAPMRKLTKIEFEYKTSLQTHFLAGGHLRDLSYHDLGGFWTLHAREDCQLFFTISSGLTFDPEQVLKLSGEPSSGCDPNSWYRVSISIMSGDKKLNITRTRLAADHQRDFPNDNEDHQTSNGSLESFINVTQQQEHGSYVLESSVELLHQVQLGGDLAKFGESSSIPFSGCMRRIQINGHSFDSRDFVTSLSSLSPLGVSSNSNQQQAQQQQQQGAFGSPISATNQQQQQQVNATLAQFDVISSRMAQGYVTLDSCQLVNPCTRFNPCKNNGICKVNELGEPDCDCSKTGYTGRRCHFSIYKQSCQDLFLSGQVKSSYYLIDLDRNGPLRPVRVRCNMEDSNRIETALSHNLPAEYLIRRSASNDIVLDITYLAFHHMYTYDGFYLHDDDDETSRTNQELMLASLIGQSLFCRQYFRYECRSAPLELGNKTWMEVPYPRRHKLMSLDGGRHEGQCSCATSEKKCLDPRKSCNCDSGESIWSDDSFELSGHEQVGLTRIVLLKQDDDEVSSSSNNNNNIIVTHSESQSRFTLSDLKCYGTKQHGGQHEITFKTSDAYIEVPGWRRGDISFSFRTASNPPAIVLYQVANSRNHGYFRLTLVNDVRLMFEFIVNRRPRKLFLSSVHKLNNGEWQQVFIEYDSANLRLTVNDDSAMIDLDQSDHLGTFEGPLFIGGAPSKYLVGDLSKRNGFTGCFRGLNINGRSIDLKSYLSPSMPSVISGCQPSCTKNLCQNGGKCIEYWGSYECECSNPFAHSGSNCEINLNTNSITFVTQEAYYVQYSNDSSTYPPYLMKNLLLNIRTYQETALVLYASDRFNNFIQLHKNGSSLVLTFNSNTTIVTTQVPIEDPLNPSEAGAGAGNGAPSGAGSGAGVQLASGQSTAPVPASFVDNNHNNNLLINATQPANQQTKNGSSANGTNLAQKQASIGHLTSSYSHLDKFIRVGNTSGSGQPIQVKIERSRIRTTFYVNNNFVVIEKPMVFLTNYTQMPWTNPELELVRPNRPKVFSRPQSSRIFLANIDDQHFNTRLPGFTGCIQGFSINNQLLDFNRAHLVGEFRGDYKIGCKMHCDSFPCKNQGTCIENWMEDRIQCKCDTTSYVGRLCDEDIAAIFNGDSSYFVYNLSQKLIPSSSDVHTTNDKLPIMDRLTPDSQNEPLVAIASTTSGPFEIAKPFMGSNRIPVAESDLEEPKLFNGALTGSGGPINFLEISLAFSSDTKSLSSEQQESSVQVLVLITNANSSRHFFLGLTSDGSLLIQEDYGNSMSLSRLVKKADQPYSDGHRHMVKYYRYNQTIQIIVDHQTYLPTMNVITGEHASRFSKSSLILVGTAGDKQTLGKLSVKSGSLQPNRNYTNYNGCISNLLIKMDDVSIEPLSEAFGQSLDMTPNGNTTDGGTGKQSGNHDAINPSITKKTTNTLKTSSNKLTDSLEPNTLELMKQGDLLANQRGHLLNLVSEQDNEQDHLRNEPKMGTIIARDVEQGKCAPFKRPEMSNGKRSTNEPKYTPLLDPRPVYMDPPRAKAYRRSEAPRPKNKPTNNGPSAIFYCSLVFLVLVLGSALIYAYVLQVRYKSEKFRCDTPFFHKRDELSPTT